MNEIQSPSSMNAAAWPPPVSVVASFWTPGSPVPRPSAVRPVCAQYSACLSLGWRIASSRPVIAPRRAGALVGVGRLDDREDVRFGAVTAVGLGLERALAALLLGQLVRVLVVAQRDVERHVVAVDRAVLGRAVLGVGDGDLVGHDVAELRDLAVLGDLDRDLGPGVAGDDRHGVDAGHAGLVGHGQLGAERCPAVSYVWVGFGSVGVGVAVTVEVPRVGERGALGVDRSLGGELHLERQRARVGVGRSRARSACARP